MSHILLVDDDDSLRTMLRITLVRLGHEVREARNGREAMALYAQQPADLVLTDIIMPEQEGVQMIGELRSKHPGAKIVAMSGGGRGSAAGYLKIAKAMGADRVLTKPFSNDEMIAVLAELLG